jgi:hypothetical protein
MLYHRVSVISKEYCSQDIVFTVYKLFINSTLLLQPYEWSPHLWISADRARSLRIECQNRPSVDGVYLAGSAHEVPHIRSSADGLNNAVQRYQ